MLIAYTDYPFVELGDTPQQKAPIRQIEVGMYDEDKYVNVYVNGRKFDIKSGYIYTEAGRLGEVPQVGTKALLANNKVLLISTTQAANES